ncbi:DNA-directed RNA polymerase subunit beta, partial [Parcubacteria bacterium DG_74_2]
MKVKSFSKSKVSFHLPYLLGLQQEDWTWFWEKGIKELFYEISPIQDYTGKEFELWFLDYKLGKSKYKNPEEAKQNDESYEAPLKAKIKLVDLKTKRAKEQEVFLCDFPLMTERGTFIVNGVERAAISQIIRSPGAFFTVQNIRGKQCFGAKIIPSRGSWLEFETEPSGFIGVKVDRRRKVAATTLVKAFAKKGDLRDDEIIKLFADVDKGKTKYIKETLMRDLAKNQAEALVEIYRRIRPGELGTPDTAKELIENMFFNFKRYDLSKVGRWRMYQRLPSLKSKIKNQKSKTQIKNQKLNKEITIEDRVLKPEDVVAVIHEIIRLNNNPEAKPDEIDHLGNRRVRTLGELLQNRLRVGLLRIERIIKDRMSTLDSAALMPGQLVNPRLFMAATREFFTSSQFSQFMDNENPLAEL